jgi:hypothetical protein
MADSTTITKRTRMEFADHVTLKEVKDHQWENGGWVAFTESGKIYWYCHNYTRSEVCADLPGYIEIS